MPEQETHRSTAKSEEGIKARKRKLRKKGRSLLLPSPDATTNLLIADIIARSASRLFRQNVERRVVRASPKNSKEARDRIGSRSAVRTLALYGISKVATKSRIGLGVVTGGLVVKTLYDIGKARQKAGDLAQDAIEQEHDQQ